MLQQYNSKVEKPFHFSPLSPSASKHLRVAYSIGIRICITASCSWNNFRYPTFSWNLAWEVRSVPTFSVLVKQCKNYFFSISTEPNPCYMRAVFWRSLTPVDWFSVSRRRKFFQQLETKTCPGYVTISGSFRAVAVLSLNSISYPTNNLPLHSSSFQTTCNLPLPTRKSHTQLNIPENTETSLRVRPSPVVSFLLLHKTWNCFYSSPARNVHLPLPNVLLEN